MCTTNIEVSTSFTNPLNGTHDLVWTSNITYLRLFSAVAANPFNGNQSKLWKPLPFLSIIYIVHVVERSLFRCSLIWYPIEKWFISTIVGFPFISYFSSYFSFPFLLRHQPRNLNRILTMKVRSCCLH